MSDSTPDFTGALDLDRDAPNPYARDFSKERLTCAEIEQITFAFYKLHSPRVVVSSVVPDLASRFKMPIGIIRSVVDSIHISDQEGDKQELIETLKALLAYVDDLPSPRDEALKDRCRKVLEKYA